MAVSRNRTERLLLLAVIHGLQASVAAARMMPAAGMASDAALGRALKRSASFLTQW